MAITKFNGSWRVDSIFVDGRAQSLSCNPVHIEIKGAQLTIYAPQDTCGIKAVYKIKDHNFVDYIYIPQAINPQRFTLRFSEKFIRKYFYLNVYNVGKPNCTQRGCASLLAMVLYDTNSYDLEDNTLRFFGIDSISKKETKIILHRD